MIKSMTGFGRGESKGKYGRFTVEIRTVNHRYFDVSSRMPNSLNQLEDRIKKYLNQQIKRGKVNFSLLHRSSEKDFGLVKLDEKIAAKYYNMLNRIKKKFKLKDEVSLSNILSFPDVIVQEHMEHDVDSVWPVLQQAVKKAVLDCNKMRKSEGRTLYRDLTKRIDKVGDFVDRISKLAPKVVSQYRDKLDAKIKDILKSKDCDIDKSRLETEIAIFARQSDIAEEITRARSHLNALKDVLISAKEAGRRLDFILQELQREINTLGAKAGNAAISQLVVEIKSEIEKMREQAQNVE